MINPNLALFGAAADPTYRPLQPAAYVPMTGNPATYGQTGGEHLFFQNVAPTPIAPPTPAPEITNPMQAKPWWMQPQDGGGDGGRNMMGGAQGGATLANETNNSNPTMSPLASAEAWDKGQKVSGFASGALGPLGMLASTAAGQYARMKANDAFPKQEPIGFFEDMVRPDILFGSPLEIQKERAAREGRSSVKSERTLGGYVSERQAKQIRDAAERAKSSRASDRGGYSGNGKGSTTRSAGEGRGGR